MTRWMCEATTKDQVIYRDLLERIQLDDLAKVLHTRQLRWLGQVERSDGQLKKVQKLIPQEVMVMAALRKPGQKWSAWTA